MRASGYERAERDWYCEPRWIVDALLSVETFAGACWDPAAGGGNIPDAVIAQGLPCIATDIRPQRDDVRQMDFLNGICGGVSNIISNPPYGVIVPWVDRARSIATEKVAILGRLAFLEGQARRPWFQSTGLTRVWVSSRRPSMPPGGVDMKASGGSIAFAWFVWERGHSGAPSLGWLP